MVLEENKTVLRRIIETINNGNLASLDELIVQDFVYQTNQIRGLEVIKQVI